MTSKQNAYGRKDLQLLYLLDVKTVISLKGLLKVKRVLKYVYVDLMVATL
jgi:hypothetical protein